MYHVLKDLSTVTTTPQTSVNKIFDITTDIICDNVLDAINNNENDIKLDIGIGKLVIKIDNSDIRYRFEPSETLNNNLRDVIISKISPLSERLVSSLSEKIFSAYKDLL